MAAGKEDIAPELLKKVQEDYRKRCENDKELARIEALAESGKANGKDTDAYAVRAGELLAAALHDNVSGDVLPDGKMYFNIANRVLPPVLRDNYELVAGMSTRIQQMLNDNAGLHMKALRPDLNEDRVKGLVNLAASADQYEDKRKELEADVVNFSQRISADGFHKNAEFQYTSGFTPKIRREAESGCCKWCQALEGTYDYADVRDTGNDVWRRHRGCRCIVEYDPGTGRRQNARTKVWSQADDHRKKIEDAERMMEERAQRNDEENSEKSRAYKYGEQALNIDGKYLSSDEYRNKFRGLTSDTDVDNKIYEYAKSILNERSGTKNETLILVDKKTGDVVLEIKTDNFDNRVKYSTEDTRIIKEAHDQGKEIFAIHNHPEGFPPTADDSSTALDKGYSVGITVGHNGNVWLYYPSEQKYSASDCDAIHEIINQECEYEKNVDKIIKKWKDTLEDFGIKIHERK